jgi:glycosyltransferase involved in cell wall biosynthesis
MTLEILICTIDEGAASVPQILLPQRKDVRYLVSMQYTDEKYLRLLDVPELHRTDVTLTTLAGRGLSRNRNHAFRHATGDVMLLADDDVRYENDYFDRILSHFEADTTLDIACFQALGPDGAPVRNYAPRSFDYAQQPRGSYFCSWEIAVARRKGLPRFDERFGLGSDFLASGEEEVFLFDAYRCGFHIQYFPDVVVRTDPDTTGTRFDTDAAVQRSKGAVLCMMHGPVGAFARCLKVAVKRPSLPHRLDALREMGRGILYVLK